MPGLGVLPTLPPAMERMKFTRPRPHIPDFPRRHLVLRSLAVLLVSAGVAFVLFGGKPTTDAHMVSLSQLALLIKSDRMASLEVSDAGGRATNRSGEVFSFSAQRDKSILKVLSNLGVSPDELSRIAYTVADPPVFLAESLAGRWTVGLVCCARPGRLASVRQPGSKPNAVLRAEPGAHRG